MKKASKAGASIGAADRANSTTTQMAAVTISA
jgi:hypothetical protein